MAQKEQVISVSMTLNTKGFSNELVLTQKQATTLGKQIASALTIDNKASLASIKAINSELAKVKTVATSVKGSLRDALNISSTQNLNNIRSMAKEMGALQTKAQTTATALKSVKFLIGDSNRNIQSVINKLDQLEKKAKAIGNVTIGVSSTGGTTRTTAGGRTYTTPAGPPSPITISSPKDDTYYSYRPGFVGPQETRNRYSTGGPYKSTFIPESDLTKDITPSTRQLVATMSKAGKDAKEGFISNFSTLTAAVDKIAAESQNRFSTYFNASFFGNFLASAMLGVIEKLKSLTTETVIYAARTQELGVVLNSLARVNGISTETIIEQEVAIKRLNITTQDTRETLAKFINVGFDLSKASPLARVAQDLAVIGNKNTSEELNQLVIAIQTLQSRNLRSAGVFLTVDEVLDKLSATTGRARDSFSTLEKQEAVLNAVLEYGAKVSGTYDAAMETVSKRMRSLERNFYEAQNALGKAFIPEMEIAVDSATSLLQAVQRYPESFLGAIRVVGLLTTAMIALRTQAIQGLVGGLVSVKGELKGLVDSRFGFRQTELQKEQLGLAVEQATIEKAKLLEVKEQITAQGQAIILKQRDIELGTIQVTQEEEKLLAIQGQANAIRLRQTNRAIEASEKVIASKGESTAVAGSGLAGFIGKATLFLTLAAVVSEVATAIKEAKNAPALVTNLDLSAATKTAQDIKNVKQYSEDLKKIQDEAFGTATQQNNKLLEIYDAVDITIKARIDQEVGINKLLDNRKATATAELAILEEQNKVLARRQRDKIEEGVTNVKGAVKNLLKGEVDTKAVEEGLRASLAASSATGISNFKDYREKAQVIPFGSAIYSAGSDLDPYFGFTQVDIAKRISGGHFSPEVTAAYYDKLRKMSEESNKTLAENRAQVESTAKDFEKLYDLFGNGDSLRTFTENYFEVSDTFKQTTDVLSLNTDALGENDKAAKILLETIDRLHQAEVKLATDFASGGASGALSGFGASFNKERKKYLDEAKAAIDKKNLNEEEKKAALERSANLFDSGLATTKGLGTYGDDIKRTLTNEFVTQGKTSVTLGDVTDRIEALKKEKQAIIDRNDTSSDTKKAELESAQGSIALFNALEKQTQATLISQKVNEGFELSLYGMSKSLFEATNALGDFYSKSPRFLADDLKADKINRVKSLAESFVSKAGEVGLSAEKVQSLKDKAKNLPLEQQKTFYETENKILDANLKLTETKKSLADLSNKELQKLERQAAVEQGVLDFKENQLKTETEIAILKRTSILPAVSAQLLAEKAVLQNIQDRKQAEQQLTADIAVEVDKRNRYNLDSTKEVNRIVAETFLERTRDERAGQEGLLKAVVNLEASRGNTDIFANNPQIKEAVRQSIVLEKIQAQGGVLKLVGDRTNEILSQDVNNNLDIGNQLTQTTNNNLTTIDTTLTSGFSTLAQAIQTISLNQYSTDAASNFSGTKLDFARALENGLISRGLSPQGARVLTANLGRETGFNASSINQRNPDPKSGFNYSLLQWQGGREKTLFAAGAARGHAFGNLTIEDVLDAIITELNSGYSKYGNVLKNPNASLQAQFEAAKGYVGFTRGAYTDRSGKLHPAGESDIRNQEIYNQLSGGRSSLGTTSASVVRKVKEQDDQLTTLKKNVAKSIGPEKDAAKRVLEDYQAKLKRAEKEQAEFLLNRLHQITGTNKELGEYSVIETAAATEIVNQLQNEEANKKHQITQYRLINKDELSLIEHNNIIQEYTDQIAEEAAFGAQRFEANLSNLRRARKGLQTPGSTEFNQADRNAQLEIEKAYNSTLEEKIKLDTIWFKRATEHETYLNDVKTKFYNDQNQQALNLEDREEALRIKRTEGYAKFVEVARRSEQLVRDEQRQTVEDEIESLKRYRDEYQGTALQRQDFERAALRDRVKTHQDTLDEIQKLEIENRHIRESEEDRLRLRIAQLDQINLQRHGLFLLKQYELEREYHRKIEEDFNPEEFRSNAMEKIVGEMKTQTELMSQLFSDSFDAINGGFGKLIDKMTGKLGIFGDAIGNLLKGITGNIFGSIFKNVLGDSGIAEPGKFNPLDLVAGALGIPAAAGKGAGTGATAAAANNFINANNYAANSVINLGIAAAQVAQGMVGIGGFVSSAASGIGNFGIGRPSGGGFSFGSFLPPSIRSGVSGIGGIGRSFFNFGNAVTPPVPVITPGETVSATGGYGSIIDSGGFHTAEYLRGGNRIINTSPTGAVGGAASGALSKLFGGVSLGKIGASFAAGAPLLGASLGGLLGGNSVGGQILGNVGGLLGGVAALGALTPLLSGTLLGGGIGTSLFSSTGLLGSLGLFGTFSGIGGALSGGALAGTAAAALGATVILAPIAVGLLVGAKLLARNKKRREEEKIRSQFKADALKQLQDLLKAVKADKTNGDDAISQAQSIRDDYIKAANQLTDKKTRNIALKDVADLDVVIGQIKAAANAQRIRGERDLKIVPTYASGGYTSSNLVRISEGETLRLPSSNRAVTLGGTFNGKDDILALLPKRTLITNPMQEQVIRSTRGYASGGVVGVAPVPTAQPVGAPIQNRPINAIIVLSPEEANRLAAEMDDAIIVDKLRGHVKRTRLGGLAGDIGNALAGN